MISLRVNSFIAAPVRPRSPGSRPPPSRRPAPVFGNGGAELRDPRGSTLCGLDAPTTPPCGPAHPVAIPRASRYGSRLHSAGDHGPMEAFHWPATVPRVDVGADTPAGAVRCSPTRDRP